MEYIRKAGHKIEKFMGGNRQDDDSTALSKNQQQQNLDLSNFAKILVIGETGSGKSTFINYLTNYFRNGSLQNIKVAIPNKFHQITTEQFTSSERDLHNNTVSKTDDCNQYMFSTQSKQYVFIDTPGLSDTRGSKQDDQNIMKIVESAENLGGLTAVIIVVNGAVARLTVNLQNVLVRLRGNLPDIVMDNTILVLTNSTRHAANFTIEKLEMNGNIYPYYMQNSAFSQDPNTWTTVARDALQHDWDQSMLEIKNMVETIDTFKTKSVTAFKEMKDIRNEIKSLLHAARVEVNQIQKMQDEIAAFENGLLQAGNDLVTYNNYTTARVVDKVEIVDAPYHSTLCQNCNHVCHDNCGLDETTIAGAQIFQSCWAITNGSCTECKHKCSYTAHYHAKKKVEITQETLQDVLADIKAKYDLAATNQNEYQDKITSVADAKKLLENALQQKSDEIKQLCIKLHGICSGFNLAQELSILIKQLEMEASMLKNIDAKQQADAFIRSLKELCDKIAEDQKNAKSHLPQMKIINTERPVVGQNRRVFTPSPNNNSSAAPKDIPESTASGSHANQDALALIRAISQQNSAVQVEDNKTDDKIAKQIKNSANLPKNNQSSEDINEEELKQLPIAELLTRYHKCEHDLRKANFFIHELKKRSLGESAEPLKQTDDVLAYSMAANKYVHYSLDDLKQAYEHLKQQISRFTEPDILKIGQVSLDMLREISVVYKLIQKQLAELNNQSRILPHFNPSNLPHTSAYSSMYPQMNSNIASHFNHGSSQNYPTFSGPHAYNPNVSYPQPIPTQPVFHQDPFHSQQQGFQPIIRSNTASPSDMNSGFRDMRFEPKQHGTGDSTRQSPREPFNTHTSDVRSDNINHLTAMANTDLISAYKDAFQRGQYAQSQTYYGELKQRCYGKYPTLIQSNEILFNKTYEMYQNKSLEELNRTKLDVHENIKRDLNDDNATLIEGLSKELILQAAVLDHMIADKSSKSHQ